MATQQRKTEINIVCYQGAMRSAIYGMADLFELANRHDPECYFETRLIEANELSRGRVKGVWLFPPCFIEPLPDFSRLVSLNDLKTIKQAGGVMATSCASAFILAAAGLLDGKRVTTHWGLSDKLQNAFPAIKAVSAREILIDEGDIITAAGLFAFQDLSLHLIARYGGYACAKAVADFALLDFGSRAQAYYQRFIPNKQHGDKLVLTAQQIVESQISHRFSLSALALQCCVTEKTLSRRFQQALGMLPKRYIDELTTEQARILLDSQQPVQQVAYQLGFDDASNFTRLFKRVAGMSPADYARRRKPSAPPS